ncbi:hypothetical protein OCA5_c04600 [Afipia carboxidovorans OM5]|uniref:Uncharacterized protein n=1 Tax=Afipia carboxidovorans (strain ATCC 49405 / DSM 1227 / KCTC 32145 / OM5) TaxID=504832 RepID=F8BVC4_AFIC5|nr:hypothetical protein OCA4_c04590 [Afipia carboxidovorans OM4]AEI05184.1 hypothetical protein OCA5_c04600 [Afipia carboxidovorans OM5]
MIVNSIRIIRTRHGCSLPMNVHVRPKIFRLLGVATFATAELPERMRLPPMSLTGQADRRNF